MKFTKFKTPTLFYSLLLVLSSSAMAADQEVKLLSNWSVTGAFHGVLDHLSRQDGFADTITRVDSCAAAARIIQNTDEPIIAPWDILSLYEEENHPCDILDENTFKTIVGQAHFNFCRMPDGSDGIAHIIDEGARIGTFRGNETYVPLETILAGLGGKSHPVAYSSVGDYKAALVAGEVDFIFATVPDEGMECVMTTHPSPENTDIALLSDFYTGIFHDYAFSFALIGNNVEAEVIREALLAVTETDDWKQGLGSRYDTSVVLNPSEEQYTTLVELLNNMRDSVDSID